MLSPKYLSTAGGRIAYHQHISTHNPHLPGIIFLGGFMSDMGGTKAMALQEFCEKNDYSYLRFDYFGHGQSDLTFTDGTISLWKQNAVDVIDQLTQGPQLLIGSSMGGWIMLLAALARAERVAGLIGIASAPDFTRGLIWDLLDAATQQILRIKGIYSLESEYGDAPYPITYQLIEDGDRHMLLHQEIPIHCPVRLLHGMQDRDVPHTLSLKLVEQLKSDDAQVTLIKNADHRMSTAKNIQLLCERLEEMLAICSKKD